SKVYWAPLKVARNLLLSSADRSTSGTLSWLIRVISVGNHAAHLGFPHCARSAACDEKVSNEAEGSPRAYQCGRSDTGRRLNAAPGPYLPPRLCGPTAAHWICSPAGGIGPPRVH